MTKPTVSPPDISLSSPSRVLILPRGELRTAAHKQYWEENGGSPHPETFFPGFEHGWNDTCAALSTGNEFPADLDGWAKQRAQETGQPEDAWEWEHGFKQGAAAAKQAGEH